MERDTSLPSASGSGSAAITAESPTRRRSSAASPSAAPMSMCMSRSSATFLRCSSRSRWIGFRPNPPRRGAFLRGDPPPLPQQDLRAPPADRREVEESLLVDVGYDQADLVDVADDREQRMSVRIADPGHRGAERVAGDLGEGGGLAPDVARRAFVPGGARSAK